MSGVIRVIGMFSPIAYEQSLNAAASRITPVPFSRGASGRCREVDKMVDHGGERTVSSGGGPLAFGTPASQCQAMQERVH